MICALWWMIIGIILRMSRLTILINSSSWLGALATFLAVLRTRTLCRGVLNRTVARLRLTCWRRFVLTNGRLAWLSGPVLLTSRFLLGESRVAVKNLWILKVCVVILLVKFRPVVLIWNALMFIRSMARIRLVISRGRVLIWLLKLVPIAVRCILVLVVFGNRKRYRWRRVGIKVVRLRVTMLVLLGVRCLVNFRVRLVVIRPFLNVCKILSCRRKIRLVAGKVVVSRTVYE